MVKEILDKIGRGNNPPLDEFVSAFAPLIPRTPQDALWHAEGNVYIHTSQVLHELYQLLKQDKVILSPEKRIALVLATVFHDIAKPFTTREKVINSPYEAIARRHSHLDTIPELFITCVMR